MSTKKKKKTTKKSSVAKVVSVDAGKIAQRLNKKATSNAKKQAKKFYENDGAEILIVAIAKAMNNDAMPEMKNAGDARIWCMMNNAPSVQRDEVCNKATNYRADNAIRRRIISYQQNGIISNNIDIVWAVSNAYAEQNPFSELSEKVFIVRTK